MGNAASHESRRCGLCLFQLDKDATTLNEPAVRRQANAPRKRFDATNGPLDEIPEMAAANISSLVFDTELKAFPASAERGCIGCTAIWSYLKRQIDSRGFSVDDSCMDKEMQLTWMIGDREKSTKGLTVIAWVLIDGTPKREHFRFLFEHRGSDYRESAGIVSRVLFRLLGC